MAGVWHRCCHVGIPVTVSVRVDTEFKVTQLASERAQVPMRGIPKSKLFPLYHVFSEHAPLSGYGTGIYKGCVGWGGVKGVLFFFFFSHCCSEAEPQASDKLR